MGKGGYTGGSTTIWIGDNGTSWQSSDEAESKRGHKDKARIDNRRSTKKEIYLEAQRESQRDSGLLRSFISQCVTAHVAGKLTASFPIAPKSLRKSIVNAGGAIKWLEGNRKCQIIYHEIYCCMRNEKIPFEKVWGPRRG